ncbi:hypothetical protein HYW74_04250 [Candidatus Pacearchaeota archaeon]|nr:hypothetical protein [Candidatus Pacearchaeota archaeon]
MAKKIAKKPVKEITEKKENSQTLTQKEKKNISFFSYSKSRFILPVVIILILLSIFIATKNLDNALGSYSCKFLDLSKQFNEARNTSNNESLNRIMTETRNLQQEMSSKVSSNKKLYAYAIAGNIYLAKIDPIYPVDCAFVPGSKFCSFYISEENYQCSKTVIEEQAKALNRPLPNLPEYKSMDYIMLLINLAIFFVIGYLISFLVALAYSKSKIRVNIAKD